MATTTELEARVRELEDKIKMLEGEGARVLTLGQHVLPVFERAHLAEDAVADHATHLRQEPGLDRVKPSRDELRRLLRAWQRARKHERVCRCALRECLRHRSSPGR